MANGGKQPGAGRPAGAPNKASEDIKILARRYSGKCMEQLINIATKSKVESNRLAAISQILDRGFGKPTQSISGDSEVPLNVVVTWKRNPGEK